MLSKYESKVSTPHSPPQKDLKLKDFQVLKVIGVGSFAKVYMVKHEETLYAMKVISKDQLDE